MYMCITYLRLGPWLKKVDQDADLKDVGDGGMEAGCGLGGMRCNRMMLMGH